MALYGLIGRRRCSELAEKLRVTVTILLQQFSAYISFFVTVLIETNVNIRNELNFSRPGCSKLTTALVNVSLKFHMLKSEIRHYFLSKK